MSIYDDNLRNCPRCNEDMVAGHQLCHNCQKQDDIDNLTEADYRCMKQYMPNHTALKFKGSSVLFSASDETEIMWTTSEPSKPVQFRPFGSTMVWSEKDGRLVDSIPYRDAPFNGAQFEGWDGLDVAKFISDWFIEQR